MSEIGKIIRVNALPPAGARETNVIYQVAAVGGATYTDYAIDANGDLKTHAVVDGSIPVEISDDHVHISDLDLIAEGISTQSDYNSITKEKIEGKLDKPLTDGNVQDYNKIIGLNSNGEVAKLPAGDLGKNVANSKLTSIDGAGLTLGADWEMKTSGKNYIVSGLSDVSNDTNFNTFIAQNSTGKIGKSTGKQVFLTVPTSLTEAERTAWKTAMNGGWTTNTMNVGLIYPLIVPKSTNPNNVTFITLIGSNLNLNPNSFTVKIINSSGTVVETINNSKVTLLNPNMINFSLNSKSYALGDYKVRLWNGVAEYTTSIAFTIINSGSAAEVDISGNVWSRITAGNLPFDNELVNTSNELNIGYDVDLYNYAGQNDNAVLVAYYMQSFLTATDDFVIEGAVTKGGQNYNPFGGSTGFGITTSSTDTLSAEKISGAMAVANNGPINATFVTGGSGSVNLGNGDSMRFIISKRANFVTTSIYKDDGSVSIVTNVIDNNQPTPIRFKVFATAFSYTPQATFGVKILSIRKI
ncbi:hypothetical protein [Chryseobacterium sp. MMS23-Vi53]|uniref:hypothetical protein n=1 Tax=Chryseobacterium sp. MMS23-Vi53 TaxID=3386644 RepID=UPI0039EB01EE